MRVCVCACTFNVYHTGGNTEYGVVPIADLLNHAPGHASTWEMEFEDADRKKVRRFLCVCVYVCVC